MNQLRVAFVNGCAVVEASELGWRPGSHAPSIIVPDSGKFNLSQIDRSPDGDVAGWVYKCGKLSLTVVND